MPSGSVTPAGGGFAAPSQWATSATTGGLTITSTSPEIELRVPADIDSGLDLHASISGSDVTTSVRARGKANGNAYIAADNQGANGEAATLSGYGGLSLFTTAGQKGIDAWDGPGNVLRFALLPAGQIMTGVVAAPADGALAASQLSFWFDDTNGAAKLMLKGKTADGTVVTAALALA